MNSPQSGQPQQSQLSDRPTQEGFDYEFLKTTLEKLPTVTEKQNETDFRLKDKVLDISKFEDKYREQGRNLEAEYRARPITKGQEQIQRNFHSNIENGSFSQLSEIMPLLANKDGRLGEFCKADIVKTAKQDDVGNSFVDLVCTLKLDPSVFPKDKEFSRLKTSYTFMVDVTTDDKESLRKKEKSLAIDLDEGKKANVLSFEDSFGRLGKDGAKAVVFQDDKELYSLTKSMQLKKAGDGFMINNPLFDERYRSYFSHFVDQMMRSIERSIDHLDHKGDLTKSQNDILSEYKDMLLFLEVYKNTLTK